MIQGVGSTSGIRACALRYFDLGKMELENSQNNALAKLPILKLGEYEMWEIRIKQYFQIQDYALWEVIENGNSWVPIPVTAPESGPSTALKMTVPSTTEEKMCKKNDVKARSLLLMALPNEHQLTFNQYADAQSMFIAIKARFGGNDATKKTQKALLKQQYENFNATSSESLDSIFNRLQKLVSRLAILGVDTSPEDLNVKFLRSLPSEWDTHVVVWMNKPDFETMGLDDLYTHFKIFSTDTPKLYASAEIQIQDDDLEEMDLRGLWHVEYEGKKKFYHKNGSMRARKFYQRTGRKIIIDGSSTAGYDKSKVECFNCHKMGHFARECRAPRSKDNRNWNQGSSSKAVRIEDASEKAMCAIDGAGFDWSDMAEDEIQANMALMAFTDSEMILVLKLEAQVVKYKESEVLFSEEIALLKRSVGHKEYLMGLLKTELEKVKEEKEGFEFKLAKFEKSSKDLDDLLASQVTDKSKKGFGYNAVPSPHPLILNRPTPLDLSYTGLEEFKQPEVNEYGPRDSSLKPTTVCDRESDNSKENTDDSLTQQPKTVTETSSVMSPLKVDKDWKEKFFHPANHIRVEEPKKARENTAAPIIEDWVSDDEEEVEPIPKVEKKTAIPTATKKESVKPEKPIRRSSRQTVNTVRPNVNTVRARGFNVVKPSACWVWRPIKPNGTSLSNSQLNDKGFVDSGCSRHMSGNIAHLSDFKDFDGDVKSASTPTDLEKPLVKDGDADDVDEHLYRSMIGSLMYLTASRPDIMFAVCACARLISWQCKKQTVVATSTTEAEYVAAASCCGQIINFLNRSHIYYALTKKPKVCVSFIKQFWRSAEASIDDNGEVKINATIDGHSLSITEGSLRRHLKLADQDGITFIPNSEIFEQLALMGYHTDSDKVKKLEARVKIGKAKRQARVVFSDDEVFEDDFSKNRGGKGSEKANDEVSTAGAKKGTASEEVPIVSTAEVNLSTAGGTVTYSRRSAEKRSRQDKGKAIMIEEEPKKKSKKELEQERLSYAEAIRLEEQMNEEQRAQIARDEEIARQWDEEERQRAMDEAKSAKKIDWNDPSVIRYHTQKLKPKTVAQARRNMIKYLKNQGNYKISDFKGIPVVEEEVDTQEELKEVVKEPGAKRKKSIPRKSTRKRQKLEEDAEKEELKGFLDIIPREEVPIEVESISTKFPIVDWKTYVLTETFMYYQVFRGDGSSKNYKILSEMLEDFDRQDVEELYRLVKERYSTSRPEGFDLMLWGDLHTLFEPDEDDEIWKDQHEYNLLSWRLCDFCGIHILLMENGLAIHMLTEKKYPLSQEMLTKMLSRKLEVDHESSRHLKIKGL
ncbi:ribonuclease H-like domain-containing protein [Tanacetum coccineum]|uniref:Ribonuclease H-like domain-containing protein n=1 Tax=Tanacetum coccineum TaxID=301880 RepID=A0ABQ5DJK2_9ASTR